MTNWLGPLQLLKTGLRASVASTLGAFADPRDVHAALVSRDQNPPIAVQGDGDIWVDYLADTGDGWNSTYSVALCVSGELQLKQEALRLERSRVLLLGGDQVYPTPAQAGYRTHFVDPFHAAFPATVSASDDASQDESAAPSSAPMMFAIPGNHDWYDGLRGFDRLFCSQKPIGGWSTRQRTSYYALQLPHGWWIWGLDLQLESAIDRSQMTYFELMCKQLKPGDRVVVCAPEPSWVDEAERVAREEKRALPSIETQTPRFRSLREIEQMLDEHLVVVLAGDSHHYARYEALPGTVGPQRITCGGGGAFLLGTHQLPDLPKPFMVGESEQCYRLAAAYPDKKASAHLRNKAWRLPTRNASFCAMLAFLYLLFLWVLQSASKVPSPMRGVRSLMEVLADLAPAIANLPAAGFQLYGALAHSPASVVFALAVVASCGVFSATDARRAPKLAFAVGALHGVLHLLLAFGLLWLMGRVNLYYWNLPLDSPQQVLLFLLETLVLGGGLGGLLFGLWMVMSNAIWGLHGQEVFSSQRIASHKCFLRMRFCADRLIIYPIKLEEICKRWSVNKGVIQEAKVGRTWKLRAFPDSIGPRFVPTSGTLEPALIEPPIEILCKGDRHERT
jgi:hypothetical protein